MGDNRGKKRPAEEAFADDLEFDTFAPNGDVTFVFGEGKTRVRVNSAVMKNASPVFAAMLGPNFKEEYAPSAGDSASVDVLLPEDDAVAFGWICRVLHSQADTNLWSPSPQEITRVLDVAEKYELLKGIQISVRVWVDRQKDPDPDDLWLLSLANVRHILTYAFCLAILEESRNKTLSKITDFLHTDLPKALEKDHCRHYMYNNSESGYRQVFEVLRNVTEVGGSIKRTIEHLLGALFKLFTTRGRYCTECVASRLK